MTTKTTQAVRPGDVVAIAGRHVGDRGRTGEILEVLGDDLHPHYRVRWEDGRESILYPGEGTTIHRLSSPVAGSDG
jgi:Domain of unknown function (DUF1918)